MSDFKHILDVWETPETMGIFSGLQKLDVPWKSLNNSESLDLDYYYNHSGQKIISPLVRSQLVNDVIDEDHNDKIAKMLYTICGDNWKKLYNALTVEYNPIENADAYITETTDRTGSGSHTETLRDTGTDGRAKTGTDTLKMTGTDTTTKTGTDTLTETGTDTTKHTGTDSVKGKVDETTYHHQYTSDTESNPGGTSETINGMAGFNSDDYTKDNKSTTTVKQEITTIHRTLSIQTDKDGNPVLDDKGEQIERPGKNSDTTENTHEDTTTYKSTLEDTKDLTSTTEHNTTDTQTLDRSDETSYNTNEVETLDLQHDRNGSESTTGKEEHTLHRHGNIGVTTNQQMITEEINLRKNFFFELVFSDIDKYLTLAIY